VLLIFLPVPTFFVYGPLLLVSFILGIVAIAQRRIANGIGIILACILGAPMLLITAWLIGLLTIGSALNSGNSSGTNASVAATSPLERARQRAEQIRQTSDFKITRIKAETGDPASQRHLAELYLARGDTNAAAAWLRAAATNTPAR
jgi:hypothetical protein